MHLGHIPLRSWARRKLQGSLILVHWAGPFLHIISFHLDHFGRTEFSPSSSLALAPASNPNLMVSQNDATTSRLKNNKYPEQDPSPGGPHGMGQGNTAYCQTSPLYVDGKDATAATLVSLAEEARLATQDVKAPTSNAILKICKSLVAGGVAGGV